ncbi:hypothetical protein WJX73_008543 [Symbiochloris irregularis]|uniref:Ribosome production factor 2 homolog n=1 Tax=Symbiochloris irregularis TaxID=706552 RepID=A0AAW1NN79_9CHLO
MSQPPSSRLVKPKTQKGKRVLKEREPKQEEVSKRALFVQGEKTSQIIKDVLRDLHKITQEGVKYTRKNPNMRPFEAGGEVALERFANKMDCGIFALGAHSKKRPHSLTLGRIFDNHLYDLCEMSVQQYRGLQDFASAASQVQAGNKPCMVFAGQAFESSPQHRLVKSMLLDLLRGLQVETVNLAGLDHVIMVAAAEKTVYLRQYAVKLKKSGSQVPRVELEEMGPALDLALGRFKAASKELHKEAHRRHKPTTKKEKNVSTTLLDGKVGRVYVPRQDLDSIALHKMKGLKRERQAAAAAASASEQPSKRQRE